MRHKNAAWTSVRRYGPAAVARLIVAVLTAQIAALTTFVTPAEAETRWQIAHPTSASSADRQVLQRFADGVRDATAGALAIDRSEHPATQAAARRLKHMVAAGRSPLAALRLTDHADQSPLYAIDWLPHPGRSLAEMSRARTATRPILARRLAEDGLVHLFDLPAAAEHLLIRTPDTQSASLQGLALHLAAPPDPALVRLAALARLHLVPLDPAALLATLDAGRADLAILPAGHDPTSYAARGWTIRPFRRGTITVVASARALDALRPRERSAVLAAANEVGRSDGSLAPVDAERPRMSPPLASLLATLSIAAAQVAAEWRTAAGADGWLLVELLEPRP